MRPATAKPKPIGQCVCRGDPHCYAFDADRTNETQELFTTNICRFVLATDKCSDSANETFVISALFDKVKRTVLSRSFVKEVMIEHDNIVRITHIQICMSEK